MTLSFFSSSFSLLIITWRKVGWKINLLFIQTDPSNMGGLSLLMEGNQVKNHQFMTSKEPDQTNKTVISPSTTGQPMYQWPTHQVGFQ